MEKNNRILIVAVLILLLGVITFNFNSISGRSVHEDVTVSVDPDVVEFNFYLGDYGREPVEVTVIAPNGVDRDFNMHRGDDGRRIGGTTENLCGGSICFGENSKIVYLDGDALEDGQYYFMFTRNSESIQSPRFWVVHN